MNGSPAMQFHASIALQSELQHFRADHTRQRFTIDGSQALEKHLAEVCDHVLEGVQELIPARKLDALVLGGGYGRGQGGVLRMAGVDAPYNDMEFYVFLRGARLLNERRFRDRLQELGEKLSPAAGLHVEFKIDSFARFRRSPITMFSYDLVSGHRVLFAPAGSFTGCTHHLDSSRIPLHEATRLLMNRCTGLLLAMELLGQQTFTSDDSDFVGRNLAKLQLALGDVLLTAFGRYHWNCLERHDRLQRLLTAESILNARLLEKHHAAGVEFKLHPFRAHKSREELTVELAAISDLARQLWLWLENRRLRTAFESVRDYALSRVQKCNETSAPRAVFVNARLFRAGVCGRQAFRYPRERLLNSLPLLLWENNRQDVRMRRQLQMQLRTPGSDWQSFVAAYKRLWPSLS
jgi:hypothetical protein